MEPTASAPTPAPSPTPMRRNIWMAVGLLVLILVASTIYVLVTHHTNNKAPVRRNSVARRPAVNTTAPKTTQQAMVSITESGFNPQTIDVAVGGQVTWTNTDSKTHEVAADPYPTDNSIPGFDNNQVLQHGESYSFSFSKAGTYHVHDQLNPIKITGTVVVK